MRAHASFSQPVLNSHTAELAGAISWYLERRGGVLESDRQSDRCKLVFGCPGMLQPGSPISELSTSRKPLEPTDVYLNEGGDNSEMIGVLVGCKKETDGDERRDVNSGCDQQLGYFTRNINGHFI